MGHFILTHLIAYGKYPMGFSRNYSRIFVKIRTYIGSATEVSRGYQLT